MLTGVGAARQDAGSTLVLVASMGEIMLLAQVLWKVSDSVRTAQAEVITDKLGQLVREKSVAIDLAFYESPAFHDPLAAAAGSA